MKIIIISFFSFLIFFNPQLNAEVRFDDSVEDQIRRYNDNVDILSDGEILDQLRAKRNQTLIRCTFAGVIYSIPFAELALLVTSLSVTSSTRSVNEKLEEFRNQEKITAKDLKPFDLYMAPFNSCQYEVMTSAKLNQIATERGLKNEFGMGGYKDVPLP